jgi:hypothetical protein
MDRVSRCMLLFYIWRIIRAMPAILHISSGGWGTASNTRVPAHGKEDVEGSCGSKPEKPVFGLALRIVAGFVVGNVRAVSAAVKSRAMLRRSASQDLAPQ